MFTTIIVGSYVVGVAIDPMNSKAERRTARACYLAGRLGDPYLSHPLPPPSESEVVAYHHTTRFRS